MRSHRWYTRKRGMSSQLLVLGCLLSSALSSLATGNMCTGTTSGFSANKTDEDTYRHYKEMYTNCTYVLNNVVIEMQANSKADFDFGFLSGIREVEGYVLVYKTDMVELPLDSLVVIHGKQLVTEPSLSNKTSLLIKSNPRLRYLNLRSLREISNGDVILSMNENLSCHTFHSVDWNYIFSLTTQLIFSPGSQECIRTDQCNSFCNGSCWGPEKSQCQQVTHCFHWFKYLPSWYPDTFTDRFRRARCSGPNPSDFCPPECSGGCNGSFDSSCYACRHLRNENRCVLSCPSPVVYDYRTYTFVANPQKKYVLGSLCVQTCPDGYAILNENCVSSCPGGYINDTQGSDKICRKCNGTCPKTCPVDFDVRNNTFMTPANIRDLGNCTTIIGNLVLSVERHDSTDLDVLRTLKKVTGYIYILSQVSWLTNLTFLENLVEIGGTQTYANFSLVVIGTNINYLGLRSLQKINDGRVNISMGNRCYADESMLQSLLPSGKKSDVVISGRACDKPCDDRCQKKNCWGPGPSMCLRCADNTTADGGQCNKISNTRELIKPDQRQAYFDCQCVDENECTELKWGTCTTCKNVRSNSYCIQSCPDGTYADANKTCRACHEYCRTTCDGSSAEVNSAGCSPNCFTALLKKLPSGFAITECLNPNLTTCPKGTFLSSAPPNFQRSYEGTSKFCIPCEEKCESCDSRRFCRTCKRFEIEFIKNNSIFIFDVCQESNEAVLCIDSCPDMTYEGVRRVPNQNSTRPVCILCHKECLLGCTGSTASDCMLCKNKRVNLEDSEKYKCVESCPGGLPKVMEDDEHQHICLSNDMFHRFQELKMSQHRLVLAGSITGSVVLALGASLAIAIVYRRRAAARSEKSNRYQAKMLGKAVSTESLRVTDAPPDLACLRLVKESEIRRGCEIGSGAFGTVYKGMWLPEGEGVSLPVAIKVLQKGTTSEQNKELLDEARIMATAIHPCCLRLVAVCLTSPMMLLTQLMPNGCLLEYVRKNKAHIGSKALLDWCTQIAMGMEYLEGRGIVHRDLAARNVLVQNSGQVRITDFGLAKVLEYNANQYEATSGKMPIKWMALESITQQIFTHKTDVWSYGVTLWELFTYGQRPYDGVRNNDIPQLLELGQRLSQPSICTVDVYMILVKCWMLDADSRPRFIELIPEFSRMSKDPGRYLVIAGDKLMKLNRINHTAQDLLSNDVDLAAVVTEHGSKVMDVDEYLQPASLAPTTFDGYGTSALDHTEINRNIDDQYVPASPVRREKRDRKRARSSVNSNSRYSSAPARPGALKKSAESAAEEKPFIPVPCETGYIQPQPPISVDGYADMSPTRDQYLNFDQGFAQDKLNLNLSTDTAADSEAATVGKVTAALQSHEYSAPDAAITVAPCSGPADV